MEILLLKNVHDFEKQLKNTNKQFELEIILHCLHLISQDLKKFEKKI